MRRLMLLTPLLIAAAPATVVGEYRVTGVPEAAGGIELRSDGRFRYAFSYGALDETAEGVWHQHGQLIFLTTDPKPRPPSFTVASLEPGKPGSFQLRLENPAGQPIPNIEVKIGFKSGETDTVQTRLNPDTDHWMEGDIDARHTPISLQFRIPVFDVHSQLIPVDVTKARRYRIVLDPADLGERDFQDWALDIKGDMLVPEGARQGEGFRRVR